jgi:hypothetical protein
MGRVGRDMIRPTYQKSSKGSKGGYNKSSKESRGRGMMVILLNSSTGAATLSLERSHTSVVVGHNSSVYQEFIDDAWINTGNGLLSDS